MIQKNQPLESKDFSIGLFTKSTIFSDPNKSPNCMDIKWFFDGAIGKRLGSSTTNTIALGSTSVSGWTINSSGTLSTSLQSFWKLEEAQDTRFDSFDGVNLTDINTMGNIVGIRGQAALFVKGQSNLLFAADTATIQSASNFSISTWLYVNSTSQFPQTIVAKMPIQIDTATTLMLHLNGLEGSVSFPDSGIKNYSISSGAGVSIAQSQYKFGGASAVFTGTAAFLSAPDNADWRLDSGVSTNDWTVDFWVRFNSLSTRIALVGQYASSGSNWLIYVGNGPTLAYNVNDVIRAEYLSPPITTGQWIHCAIVNSAGTILTFVNGTAGNTGTAVGIIDINSVLAIGSGNAYATNGLDGYIDELRVSKGIARWVTDFTPPSLPYGTRDYEYNLFVNTDNVITFRVSSSGIAEDATVRATSFGTINTATWMNIVAWHSNNAHIGLTVNLNTTTAPYTSGVKIGSAPFSLGSISNNQTDYSDARIDETGYWKKVLSQGEKNDLYGGGSGNTFTSGASGYGWAMFDFGASSLRWLTVAAGTGIAASSNLGTTFVNITTSNRTQTYQYMDRSRNVLIMTSDAYDPTLYWAGSAGTFANVLAINSAPSAKYNINYQGFLILLNFMDSNGTIRKRGFSYADENFQLTNTWGNSFDFPSSSDDEITAPFILNKFLYVSTKYKLFRVAYVGGNPDWSFLKVKDWGFVPRTVALATIKGSQVAIGMDWQHRLRVFDGNEDLFISDNVENDNNYCNFGMNKISYAGSGLVYSHATFDYVEQEYRLNCVIGLNSTNTTHAIVLNGRTMAMYPYSNQQYQAMCVAESNNQQHLMAIDRSGFVHILNSGNLDVSNPIAEEYDSPFMFNESPNQVSKSQQLNFLFNNHSSGVIHIQDRINFSNVFGEQSPLRNPDGKVALTATESSLLISRNKDVPSTYNVYQFRLTSSSNTVSSADPWELNHWELLQQQKGFGKG